MFFNLKLTAVFTALYSLVATAGMAPLIVQEDEHSGCDGTMPFQPHMLTESLWTNLFNAPVGLVLGAIAVVVMVKYTPDFWSYRRSGLTLWFGMMAAVPALIYALERGQDPSRLYYFLLNAAASGLGLTVITAMLKRRRLAVAIKTLL